MDILLLLGIIYLVVSVTNLALYLNFYYRIFIPTAKETFNEEEYKILKVFNIERLRAVLRAGLPCIQPIVHFEIFYILLFDSDQLLAGAICEMRNKIELFDALMDKMLIIGNNTGK